MLSCGEWCSERVCSGQPAIPTAGSVHGAGIWPGVRGCSVLSQPREGVLSSLGSQRKRHKWLCYGKVHLWRGALCFYNELMALVLLKMSNKNFQGWEGSAWAFGLFLKINSVTFSIWFYLHFSDPLWAYVFVMTDSYCLWDLGKTLIKGLIIMLSCVERVFCETHVTSLWEKSPNGNKLTVLIVSCFPPFTLLFHIYWSLTYLFSLYLYLEVEF